MSPRGWTPTKTTQAAIQKTVNWLAAAIHTADPAALVTNSVADVRLLLERHQRQEQLVLRQRAARRRRQAERDARLLRGPLLRRQRIAGVGHGAVAVRAPGVVLGPRQEAGDRRVLRGHDGRRADERSATPTSTTTGTTAHGRGNTTTAATRRRARRSSGRRCRRRSRTSTTRTGGGERLQVRRSP